MKKTICVKFIVRKVTFNLHEVRLSRKVRLSHQVILHSLIFTAQQWSGEGNVFSCVCPSVILSTGWSCQTFNLEPPPDTLKLLHYGARTVGKRAVGIRLKYLLVHCVNDKAFTWGLSPKQKINMFRIKLSVVVYS